MADGHIEIEVELNSDKAEKELGKFTKTIDSGTKQAAKSSENAMKQAAKSAESSVKQAGKGVEQSAKQAGKTVETSAKQAGEKASQSTKKSSEEQKQSYKQTEEQARKSAEQSQQYWSGAAGKIKNVVGTAAKASGAALVAGGTAAVASSISFESAFAGVKKTVNATDKELSTMRTSILNMSKEMPTSANEIAGVAEATGQLGIKTKNIAGFSKTMVMLGDSTNMSADTAATSLARLANITGMPQTQFDRLGSVIVDLGNNLATTESEITEMAMRIAGAGSQVGMSEAQIMSFSGALSSVGIEAEAGGTAFSTLLSKMNLATTKGGDSLNNFAKVAGMSSSQFKKSFQEDAAGAVIQFIQGLDRVNKSGGSAIKVLDDMGLSDVRMRDALLRAAGASDTFSNALKIGNNAWNENKALTNEANQRYKTLESRIGILKNKATALGIAVGDELKGPLADGVAAVSDAIGKLANQVETNGIESIIPKETITTIKNLGTVAKTVAGGGLKVLGASARFSGKNMQIMLPTAVGLLTVIKGYSVVTSIAKTISTAQKAITLFGAAQIACTAQGVVCNATLTAGQAVFGLFTGQVTAATAATALFGTATKALSGPVGWITLALGALTAGITAYALTRDHSVSEEDKFAAKIEKSAEAQKEYLKTVKENKKAREEAISTAQGEGAQADFLSKKLEALMSVENKSAGQKAQIKNIVEQLNGIMPELGLKYDEEKDKLNKSTDAIRKNIAAQKELAMAKAYGAQMESASKDIVNTEEKLTKATEKRAEANKKLKAAQDETEKAKAAYEASGMQRYSAEEAAYQKALTKEGKLQQSYKSADEQVKKYQETIKGLKTELDNISNRQVGETNYAAFLGDIDKICAEAKMKASEIPKSVIDGMKEGVYANPTTGDELKSLIKLDGIVQEAQQAGIKVPNAVAQGIQSGQYAIPTSVEQMKALIKFDNLQSKSLQSGVKIPAYLAEGISSGKIKPKTAVDQMNQIVKFDSLVNKSGQAGSKAVQKIVSAVNAGKMKPAEAIKQMNALSEKEAKSGSENIKKDFNIGIKAIAPEITKSGKKVNTASKGIAKDAKSGMESKKSEMPAVGSYYSQGVASGILTGSSSVISASVAVAMMAKATFASTLGVASPAKEMMPIGGFTSEGFALGILKNQGMVASASAGVANSALIAAKKELDIHSPSRKFKNIIGKNIPKGIAKGVREAQSELTAEMKTVVSSALSAAKNATKTGDYSGIGSDLVSGLSDALNLSKQRSSETIQEIIDQQYNSFVSANEKAEQKLQNKIDKTKNKKKKAQLKKELKALKSANSKKEKQLKQAGEKTANAYNTAFEKEAERLTSIAEEKIQKLSETYQTKYNEIKNLMDSLTEKQQSWGNIYDLDQNILDIKRYQEDLKSLENKIPESMMEKILGMNIDESTAYMDWFKSMSDAERKAYIEKWNKQQEMSKSFSESFFADDFKKINQEYQTELKKATDNLEKQMKQAGVNIANGLTAGMKSETRNMSKAMKKICDNLIKTAKKQLKIKSPSREFAEIGKYNIQGAEKGHEKEAKNLYRQMDDVSQTMAERFARAGLNVPNIQSRMQSAIASQMARVTANMQPQIVYANTGRSTTVEKTVYTGPEKIEIPVILEGKEVARVTAPYMDRRLNAIADRKLRGGT